MKWIFHERCSIADLSRQKKETMNLKIHVNEDYLVWETKVKTIKKNKHSLKNLWRYRQLYQYTHNGSLRRRGETEMGRKNTWGNNGQKLPIWWKTLISTSRSSINSNRINSKRSTPWHILAKLSKDKENFESSKREVTYHIQEMFSKINSCTLIRNRMKEMEWHIQSSEEKKTLSIKNSKSSKNYPSKMKWVA